MTKYDDYDWKELPKEVQEAATKLGYTKKMWDKDKGELRRTAGLCGQGRRRGASWRWRPGCDSGGYNDWVYLSLPRLVLTFAIICVIRSIPARAQNLRQVSRIALSRFSELHCTNFMSGWIVIHVCADTGRTSARRCRRRPRSWAIPKKRGMRAVSWRIALCNCINSESQKFLPISFVSMRVQTRNRIRINERRCTIGDRSGFMHEIWLRLVC